MKTMRYRIRLITLVLVAALLASLLWCIRTLWIPAVSDTEQETPSEVPAESVLPASAAPTAVPKGSGTPESSATEEPAATPNPLFDTYGL